MENEKRYGLFGPLGLLENPSTDVKRLRETAKKLKEEVKNRITSEGGSENKIKEALKKYRVVAW
jgi:hypothetical protein